MGNKVSSQKENINKKISWWERFKTMNALQGGDPDTPIFIDYRDMQKADNQEAAKLFEKQNKAASELDIKKGKATVNALAFIGGLKNPAGLLGDLGITTSATLANTALDGNTENLTKNLATNAMFDIAGKGVADVMGYVGKKAAPHVLRILPEPVVKFLNKTKVYKSKPYAPTITAEGYFTATPDYTKQIEHVKNVYGQKDAQTISNYLNTLEAPKPKVGAQDNVMDQIFFKDWYINRLRNIGMSEKEITTTLNRYQKNLDNVIWRTSPTDPSGGGFLGRSIVFEADPDAPKIIWTTNKSSELVPIRLHEQIHMSGMNGSVLHPKVLANNRDILLDFGDEYLNRPDEQRARLLQFARYAENVFGGDYDAAARHILDGWLNPYYKTPGGDVEALFRTKVPKESITNAAKKILGLAAPIGVMSASPEKKQQGGQIKPNFIKRLEDPNRKSILDWASRPTYRNQYTYDISTHKMGYEYAPDDTGRAIVFPEVQEVNGKLVDFTRPPYHSWAGYNSALDRGDYLIMKDLEEARKWVEGYKNRYKNLK